MIIVVSMTSQTGLYKVSKRLSQIVTFMMIQWKATNTLGLEEKASQMVLRKQLIALQQILNGLISSQTFASLMPFPPSLTTRNGCLNKTFRKRFHFENLDLSTLIEHEVLPPSSHGQNGLKRDQLNESGQNDNEEGIWWNGFLRPPWFQPCNAREVRWKLSTDHDVMVTKIFEAKYFPQGGFLEA
ncbi:hypothetical protein JHK87_030961 [Glycine soja]|nr:hypothetical protein JHK87_030961 [Glycine soja]